jgi:hypothetical protein
MGRPLKSYINEIAAGLVSTEELSEFLHLDETNQVLACSESGVDSISTIRHALRLCGSWMASYPEFERSMSAHIRRRYLEADLFNGEDASMIVFNAAWALKSSYREQEIEAVIELSQSDDWRQRLLAAFISSGMPSTSDPLIKEAKARLGADPFVTSHGDYLVRMAAKGLP